MKARPFRLLAAGAVVGVGLFGAVGLASAQTEDTVLETTEETVELDSTDSTESDSTESDSRRSHGSRGGGDGHCDEDSSEGDNSSSSTGSSTAAEDAIDTSSL